MADILSKGALFPEELISGLIQKTTGASSLAALCAAKPIPFNGSKEFTFQLDKEINIVAENGPHTKGGATILPVTTVPFKIEYGARISDEFMYASEDAKLDYLSAFSDGFSKKVAKGLDLMALHGINPRTATASTVIGDNHFDKMITQIVTQSAATADADVEAAIALVQGSEHDVNGLVMSPAFRSALAALLTTGGAKMYPELAWGSKPGALNGLTAQSSSNLSANASLDRALVGDFQNCFKWGYAKQIPIEIVQYGNPDNDTELGDLKGHGQIYIRGELYLGWGLLDATAFALIKAAS
ncbi:MAG: phage major capsid protein [Oscillospiraceae bacterium]|nr:phage major capsid protein [Oscillospiraceae bacterium]